MIVEVYPLKRMPRRFKIFDYFVEEGTEIRRGSFVRISLRKQELWGVVKRIKDKPLRGIELKSIIDAHDTCTLREEELSFFEWLANDLAQSVSSLLYTSLPQPPKRELAQEHTKLAWQSLTLPASEATHVVRIVKRLSERSAGFAIVPDLRRAAAVIIGHLQSQQNEKVLVIAPTLRDVELLRSHMTGHDPIVMTSEETNNKRFNRWRQFRSEQTGVMIGTKLSLLTIDSSVTTIFLVRSGDKNHKQYDRNPRYDVRALAYEFHKRFKINVYALDVAPRPEDLHRLSEVNLLDWGPRQETVVVDMNREQSSSKSRVLSYTLTTHIENTLANTQRVLCVYNKKGMSRTLVCSDCSHRFLCEKCKTVMVGFSHTMKCPRCKTKESLPLSCPSCNGSEIAQRGVGNQKVVKELRSMFPDNTVDRIDKEHQGDANADILVVTSYYYEFIHNPFKRAGFGLVANLDADGGLYHSGPDAVVQTLRALWQWCWLAYTSKAVFLVQTASPSLIESMLTSPVALIDEELKIRRDYNLPPFYRWARVQFKDDEPRKVDIVLSKLEQTVQAALPEALIQHSEVLEIGTIEDRFHVLLKIFTDLPDQYIIDTRIYC